MKILITGGAGCLGSSLAAKYLDKGRQVLILDNFATGKREFVPEGANLIEGSVADAAMVEQCIRSFSPTHVIHGAASYKDPDDWTADVATNVLGTVNVARAAAASAVKRLIYLQTALCYGRPQRLPIPADHPTLPITSYGITKTAAEAYVKISGTPYVSLRIANVTGPRLAIGPIPAFYNRLKSGQKCFCTDAVRDFLDMGDFLALMDLVMEEGAPQGVFNVSTGEGHSIKDVFDLVANYLDVHLDEPVVVQPPDDDDLPAVVLDPSDTEKAFGWRARVEFEESIKSTLAWYDAHGIGEVHSHLKRKG